MDEKLLYTLPVLIFGILAVLFAAWLARDVLARDEGSQSMQEIASAIFRQPVHSGRARPFAPWSVIAVVAMEGRLHVALHN